MRLPSVHLAGAAMVVGAMLATVVAPWPALLNAWMRLLGRTTVYAYAPDLHEWAQRMAWLIGFIVLAALIGPRSRSLAGVLLLLGLNVYFRSQTDPSVLLMALVITGAVLLSAARPLHRDAVHALWALGLIHAAYVLLQWGGVDPLFGHPQPGSPTSTVGNRGLAGMLLAMLGACAPLHVIGLIGSVVIGGALITTKTLGALAAFLVGLAVRYRVWKEALTVLIAPVMAGASYVVTYGYRPPAHLMESASLRFYSALLGVTDWLEHAPYVGFGIGGWAQRRPGMPVFANPPEHFSMASAHSDPLQWGYETGLIGAALLACVAVEHRRAFTHPLVGGAVVATAIVAILEWPFHAIPTALIGAVILGIGLGHESSSLRTQGA